MANRPRHLRLPAPLKADLLEVAYQERTTASAILRDIVTAYGHKGLAGVELADPGMTAPGGYVMVSFMADTPTWQAAQERATRDQVALPDVVRRAVTHKVEAFHAATATR